MEIKNSMQDRYGANGKERNNEEAKVREINAREMSQSRSIVRRETLKVRDAMSAMERQKGSLLMTERILGHQWFYRCGTFLCFASYGSEIDTSELINEAIRMGKRVFLPKVTNVSGREEMSFFRLTDLSELSAGYKGIPEPPENAEKYMYDPTEAERTLMLMPGVAFDAFRNRLGYGKGFYDGFLADKEALQLRTIAVGFRCQMVEKIPEREGDIRPYQVICT